MTNTLSHVSPDLKPYLVNREDFKAKGEIGSGTFGKVTLEIHKPTEKLCAVKKLLSENLKGKDLIDFCREVEILSKCDNLFLVPFYGWTAEAPHLIVTEFIPNGSLFRVLRHRDNVASLSGTQKTIISLGIAYGMKYLHEKNIIHRDLKSLNILLDKKYFPKICDFGASRFVGSNDESQCMTKDVGTPHWMAPEQFMTTTYTNKVDVYAYGIMLWEILTELTPFQGKGPVQIAMDVCQKQQRPAIPDGAPKKLKKLISSCWAQDPEDRPTFNQIFSVFCKKKVMFEGTEPAAIDYMIQLIKDDMICRKEKLVSFGPPLKYNKAQIIAQGPRKKSGTVIQRHGFQAVMAPANGDLSLVSNTKIPNYIDNFNLCAQNLTAQTAPEFFRNAIRAMHPTTIPEIINSVIDNVYKLIKGNQTYLNEFIQTGWLDRLPIGNEDAVMTTFKILKFISSERPTMITKLLIRSVSPFINAQYGLKTLCILMPILQMFDRIENGWVASDHLIRFSTQFLDACPNEYLKMIYYLLTNYAQFKSARIEYIYPILNAAIMKPNTEIINMTYSMMLEFYNPMIKVSADLILAHLSNSDTCDICISYIMKQKTEHLTKEIMSLLLNMLPFKKRAYYAILCSCDRTKSGDSLLEHGGSWMTNRKMDTKMVMDLLLVLYVFVELRPIISAYPEFPIVLDKMVQSDDPTMIIASSTLVLKSISLPKFYSQLRATEYFFNYVKAVRPITEEKSVLSCANFVDAISRIVRIEQFDFLIDYMARFVQSMNAYTLSALSALASMCQYPEAASKVREYNLLSFLQTFVNDPTYAPYAKAVIVKVI